MKRLSVCVSAALTAALVAGSLVGCGGQKAGQQDGKQNDQQASIEQPAQSTEELVVELKSAVEKVPTYKSVTVTEHTVSTFAGDGAASAKDEKKADKKADAKSAEPETFEEKDVYKFDASGDKLKTSIEAETNGVKITYFTDGDDAVCVSDGPVYGGTAKQFEMTYPDGVEAYLKDAIGDLPAIIDCADEVTKEQKDDVTVYTMKLNVDKYVKTDEILQLLAESETPIKGATIALGFDKDGRIVTIARTTDYGQSVSDKTLTFSDFDKTTIDPMPKATKTYEDMKKDMESKIDEVVATEDPASGAIATPPDAATVK